MSGVFALLFIKILNFNKTRKKNPASNVDYGILLNTFRIEQTKLPPFNNVNDDVYVNNFENAYI